ncbi:MAG: 50S ribosomal protein L10 [Candidatus Cloacimonadota bacterium]|nr:50S ribosomal protein L10 [Candidatus Cloacimonadota bacterium]
MIQPYKKKEVESILERVKDAKSIVLIDYKGVNIEEVDELRNRMREAGVNYFVSKNTFIKIALNELGITKLDDMLKGPTAVAAAVEDEVAPARELVKFKKEITKEKDYPKFKIGLIDGELMGVEKLHKLSELPRKDELIAKVLQGFNAPIVGFIGSLQGILRKCVYTIDAIAKKKAEEN